MPLDETEKMSQWSLTFEVRKRCGGSIQRCGARSSQWSLTFEVRKSHTDSASAGYSAWSQWSLTFEVRKSSPPRMCPSLSTRRNGA